MQVAHAGLTALLERWREQFSPREYAVLLGLISRYLDSERDRTERALKRCAA